MPLAIWYASPLYSLLGSDLRTNEEQKNRDKVEELGLGGIKVYVIRKREPENYIHVDCLGLAAGSQVTITDNCDAKVLIIHVKGTSSKTVIEDYWVLMTAEQIRQVELYQEDGQDKYELTEMFSDFLEMGSSQVAGIQTGS